MRLFMSAGMLSIGPGATLLLAAIACKPNGSCATARSDLLEVVAATHPACGLARRLNGGQQQTNQDANDGNDDQQFNERKTRPGFSLCAAPRRRGRKKHCNESVREIV